MEALDTYKKLVALLYRKIGILVTRNHPEIANKRKIKSGFFSTPARKNMSREIYRKTRQYAEHKSILRMFEEQTGLSLLDIEQAFSEGDWKNSAGKHSYGGPKWASIARVTLSLQKAIEECDSVVKGQLLIEVDKLVHNNGRIVDKFPELN